MCARGLVDRALLDDAAAAIEAVLADPSPLAIRASAAVDGAFVEDFCDWSRVPVLESLIPRCSLEVVAGSDRGPWFVPRTFLGREARWFPEGTLAEIPDYDADPPRILGWDLEPGDAVFFHFAAVHPGFPRLASSRECHRRRLRR